MEKQNKFVKDMTKGNPMQLLIQFSLPLLVGNIFQQLYNMVDSIIVGNFVGANALGAIGTTNSLNFFFFSLVFVSYLILCLVLLHIRILLYCYNNLLFYQPFFFHSVNIYIDNLLANLLLPFLKIC